MSAINVPRGYFKFMQERRWITNGRVPQADLYTMLATQTNQAVAYRRKELFRAGGLANALASVAPPSTRARWRFRGHTGPMTSRLVVVLMMLPADTTVTSPYASVNVTDGGAYNVTKTFYFGSTGTGGTAPSSITTTKLYFASVPSDSEIYGTFTDKDGARLVSAVVYEESLALDTANGYSDQNFAVQQPIYDSHRSTLAQLAGNMWTRGAAHVWNWTADQDSTATVITAATLNVIDGTSTTVTTSSPGATLDMRYKNSVGLATVTCTFAVYANMGLGTGSVILKDSAGSAIATITVGTTLQWYTVTASLPATSAKYDVHATCANTMTVYAFSLYELV
jgi:hypothetical protein